jgi:CarD family transcriptional regulator, regulator of rRNA transcription
MAQTARSTRSSSLDPVPARAKKATPPPRKTATTTKAKLPALPPSPSRLRPLKGGARLAAPVPLEEPKRVSTVVARGYVPLVDIPKLPPPPHFELHVGDKVVHPAHGLAEVAAIEHRELGGSKGEFYILRILDNGMRGMRVMVPRNASVAAGIRPVMSSNEAERVLDTMRAREVAVDLQPWSRRFRAYTEMIKSGAPHEVAKVLRDMYRLKFDKDLSFGERRLLDQAKSLLMMELAAAKKITEAELKAQVEDMFRA